PTIRARRRELAEPVPHHVLGDVDRHMAAPVVNRDREPDHLRKDDRCPAPRTDHLLVTTLAHGFDFLHQFGRNKRPFFQRTRHPSLQLPLTTLSATPHNELVRALVLPLLRATCGLAPRRLRTRHTDRR